VDSPKWRHCNGKLLLEHGAIVSARKNEGVTAMDKAVSLGHDAGVQLLKKGIWVDIEVNEEERLAALQRRKRIMQLLESHMGVG
jgi:hypothetical protein